MAVKKTTKNDTENPEWTEADFARAKPARDALPAKVLAAFKRTRSVKRPSNQKKR